MSATDHSSDVAIGCCIGQTPTAAEGFGLWKSSRAAAVTALTGFQSAIVRRTDGIRSVGTIALETIARGKTITRPIPCADSGPLLTIPMQAHIQERANAKRRNTAKAPSVAATPPSGRQ